VPDLVFDHHPMRKKTSAARFADVRADYGATATILAEYLEETGIPITRPLATGLVYAIRSETQDFGREAAGPDHAVYDRLLTRIDRRALARIQTARLPLAYFRNLRRALDGLLGVGSLVVSHLGRVDQPDIVPEVADLLLRMEGKTWSLATGSHGDRLYLSIRTTNSRADAGNLMRRLIGRRGKGGGHGTMAGGYVMLPKNSGDPVKTLEKQIGQKFAKAMRKNPERLLPISLSLPKAPSPSRAPRHDRRPREVSAGPRATGGAWAPGRAGVSVARRQEPVASALPPRKRPARDLLRRSPGKAETVRSKRPRQRRKAKTFH
jgi:hypothetical protein